MTTQHYPVQSPVLFAGEYPGDRNPEIARAKILGLVDLGVRTFIDLTSPHDGLTPYETLLPALGQETGTTLRRISLSIPDMSVPASEQEMAAIMAAIRDAIASAPAVYIHCWGGIGRTGTVVGCWLRESGITPDEALQQVQHLYSTHMPKCKDPRYPQSPQTPKQRDYVRTWQSAE